MAEDNSRKIKLLKLMELLRQETDEAHPMPASDICRRMEEMRVPSDRRTLTRDMVVLNDYGFEVMSVYIGHEKAYYIEDRSFNVPELKILIDAVQAASFITEKKTAELIDKIADLGGSHRAEILRSNMVNFNTRKHRNESIYYNVAYLEEAIEKNKKVIFRYFDLDENGKKAYRKDGGHYVAEPVALVFNEDNYYLISYSQKHDGTANYRLDRMDAVEPIDEDVCKTTLRLRKSVAGYTEQAFKMYGGRQEELTLRFSRELIGAVYDRFGEGIRIKKADADTFFVTVKVQISPTFWGWLFQFGNKMTIAAPPEVAEEYKKRIAELA